MCKTIAKENVNLYVLNQKLHEFTKSNGVSFAENRVHLKRIMLNKKVHHFPVHAPILAACVRCDDSKWAIFAIKRKKYALLPAEDISSMTEVSGAFEVGSTRYVLKDTINGFERYKPIF